MHPNFEATKETIIEKTRTCVNSVGKTEEIATNFHPTTITNSMKQMLRLLLAAKTNQEGDDRVTKQVSACKNEEEEQRRTMENRHDHNHFLSIMRMKDTSDLSEACYILRQICINAECSSHHLSFYHPFFLKYNNCVCLSS